MKRVNPKHILRAIAFALLPATCFATAPGAYADPVAITLNSYGDFTNGSWSLGFTFSPTVNIDVTSLGSFFPAGATDTHGVGLWNADGSVELASAPVIGTGGADGFDFTAIAPVELLAGVDYVVSATTGGDDYADNGATFTAAPDINYISHVEVSCTGDVACFPTNTEAFNDFGANFTFTPAAVPEPASLALLGSALVGLGLIRRRKSKGT